MNRSWDFYTFWTLVFASTPASVVALWYGGPTIGLGVLTAHVLATVVLAAYITIFVAK